MTRAAQPLPIAKPKPKPTIDNMGSILLESCMHGIRYLSENRLLAPNKSDR
jgi:hypothetical protein